MQLIIRPMADPTQEIDVTQCVVGAIAHELWSRYGGSDALNWLEAERHLTGIIERVRDAGGLDMPESQTQNDACHFTEAGQRSHRVRRADGRRRVRRREAVGA